MSMPDATLFHVLASNKKISKSDAGYKETGREDSNKEERDQMFKVQVWANI